MKKNHIHTINCKYVFQHICDNLDADLNSPKCRQIRVHIEGCDNCAAYLDSLKKTVSLYKIYPVPSIPQKTNRELFATISLLTGKTKKK